MSGRIRRWIVSARGRRYERIRDRAAQLGETKPHEYIAARNDTWRTVAAIVGGFGLFGSLFLTWWSFDLARQGQVTDRFATAVELLGTNAPDGSPNLEARLGAIYALERIAQDSERDHWPVMEVLTAYVRAHARWDPSAAADAPDDGVTIRPREDVQATMNAIWRRDPRRDPDDQRLNLVQVDLRGATLVRANLGGADLEGANLEGAILRDAYLGGADLSDARLGGADLSDARLGGAELGGADLGGADLWGVDLGGAFLNDANLSDARLSFANLGGAILARANLEGASLWEADLEGASLWEADLEGADLEGADVTADQLGDAHFDETTTMDENLRAEALRLRTERDAAATAAATTDGNSDR